MTIEIHDIHTVDKQLVQRIVDIIKARNPLAFPAQMRRANLRYAHFRRFLLEYRALDEAYEATSAMLRGNGFADPPARRMDLFQAPLE